MVFEIYMNDKKIVSEKWGNFGMTNASVMTMYYKMLNGTVTLETWEDITRIFAANPVNLSKKGISTAEAHANLGNTYYHLEMYKEAVPISNINS